MKSTTINGIRAVLAAMSGAIAFAGVAAAQTQYATFEVNGNVAYMSGELGEPTPGTVTALFRDHPQVNVIVMNNVPGSEDDDGNIKGSRIVHQRGVTTYVPADGLIASGGVDFFLAGKERIVEEGACVGVHAWADDDDPTPASELPRDHPGHKIFLDYFATIGMNPEFYWYTLQAAPAEGMYYMTTEELLHYGVATKVVPPTDGKTFRLLCDHR